MPLPISLFSQSLFAMPLDDAIAATAGIGIPAIELACMSPHFDLEMAHRNPQQVADQIREYGLTVSALSLFNSFTDPATLDAQVEAAETYIRLAPSFDTSLIKITPGRPASTMATAAHWSCFAAALDRLIPFAEKTGVRLACETHMRQLTDTLAGTIRMLDMANSDTLGLTVDFSNMTFAGEKMPDVFAALVPRMYNTHVKNGTISPDGAWRFHALDTGWTDYTEVLTLLRDSGYAGYLTIECLGPDAKERPVETAQRDMGILRRLMAQVGIEEEMRK